MFLPATTQAKGLKLQVVDTGNRVYEQTLSNSFTVDAGVIKKIDVMPLTLYYGIANCYQTAAAGILEINASPYYSFSPVYVNENMSRLNTEGQLIDIATSATVVWSQTNSTLTGVVLSASPQLEGTTLNVP